MMAETSLASKMVNEYGTVWSPIAMAESGQSWGTGSGGNVSRAGNSMAGDATRLIARRSRSAVSTSLMRDACWSSDSVWEAVMAKSQRALLRYTGTGRPILWPMGVTSIRYPAWMASSRVMAGGCEASVTWSV